MTSRASRYAVCERVLRQGSFAADVAAARAVGVGAMGVDAAAVDAIGAGAAARILDGEGVVVSSYLALENIVGDDGNIAPLGEAERRLDVAAQLGAPATVVATGPLAGRAVSDAEAVCRAWLEDVAALALDRGLAVLVEPVHPLMRHWSYVHTLDHARALVEGLPGAGVVLDLGHVWWERDLAGMLGEHVDAVGLVQVTNVDPAALAEARYDRAPLPDGDVPVAALVDALETAGYRGWYEDETIVRLARDERVEMVRASREWFGSLGAVPRGG